MAYQGVDLTAEAGESSTGISWQYVSTHNAYSSVLTFTTANLIASS